MSNSRQTSSSLKQTYSALKHISPGSPQTATGLENMAAVKASTEKYPQYSPQNTWLPYNYLTAVLWKFCTKKWKYSDYTRTEWDIGTHLMLCHDLIQNVHATDLLLLFFILFYFVNDTFPPFCTISKQNFQYCNPQEPHQWPLHSPKVIV